MLSTTLKSMGRSQPPIVAFAVGFVKGSKKHSTAEHKSKPPKASGIMLASVAPVPSSEPPAPSPPETPMSAALSPPASHDLVQCPQSTGLVPTLPLAPLLLRMMVQFTQWMMVCWQL